jgi:iron complex outermembrane receptor protein
MITLNRSKGYLLLCASLFAVTLLQGRPLQAAADPNSSGSYLDMPLDQLINVQVVSSARRPQAIGRSSTAIYVITSEDIRMSGVTTFADLLRLVPGMQVHQILGFSSQVGIRGFAQRNAARIQILMDGVSLYDSFKGGVELEFYPIILDDIDRIEVIRGPAAVAWGVNAMDGVINIITKKVADTMGTRVYGGVANNFTTEGYVSYGGGSDDAAARGTFGGFYSHGDGRDRGNAIQTDIWHNWTATGRGEAKLWDGSSLTVSGGERATAYAPPSWQHPSIEYMTMVWDKNLEKNSDLKLTVAGNYWENYDTGSYDVRSYQNLVELQHTFGWDAHRIVWGGDITRDVFHLGNLMGRKSVEQPESFANDQSSIFIQDEITLADNLWWTVGGRLQHNELSGQDWAGESMLTWEVAPDNYIRGGISRAFARPTMQKYFTWAVATTGNINSPTDRSAPDGMGNEHIVAYELGYRTQLAQNLELDVEGYYNQNQQMIAGHYELGQWTPGVLYTDNTIDVDSYGIETSVEYKPYNWWLVRAYHSYEHQNNVNIMNNKGTATDPVGVRLSVPSVPSNTIGLTNRFNLDADTTLNVQIFYTDSFFLENNDHNAVTNEAEKYTRLDIHLARKILKGAGEVAVGVKNLCDPYHYEGDALGTGTDQERVPRLWYAQFRYAF